MYVCMLCGQTVSYLDDLEEFVEPVNLLQQHGRKGVDDPLLVWLKQLC